MNGTTTISVTDAQNREVLEYDGSTGAIQRWYAYGVGPNALLNQMNVALGTRATMIPDQLGSIIGLMDSGTGALSSFAYRSYGSSAAAPAQFGYTGQRVDAESGTYYYRARQYSTGWGRFLQADPIGYQGGMHLYAYVGNDPLNAFDSNGLLLESAASAVGGAVDDAIQQPRADIEMWARDVQQNAWAAIQIPLDLSVGVAPELASLGTLFRSISAVSTAQEAASGLRFSQTTASPYFSSQGVFGGQSIGDVAAQLRSGSLAVSEVPVQTIDLGGNTLIMNTRSALSLMQGGIPQNEWNLLNMTGNAGAEATISQRLINNGLTNSGTNVLRITGSGRNASTLIPGP